MKYFYFSQLTLFLLEGLTLNFEHEGFISLLSTSSASPSEPYRYDLAIQNCILIMFKFLSYYIFENRLCDKWAERMHPTNPCFRVYCFSLQELVCSKDRLCCWQLLPQCGDLLLWRMMPAMEGKKLEKKIKCPFIRRGNETWCVMVVLFSNAFDNNAWLLLIIFLFRCCLVWRKIIFLWKIL